MSLLDKVDIEEYYQLVCLNNLTLWDHPSEERLWFQQDNYNGATMQGYFFQNQGKIFKTTSSGPIKYNISIPDDWWKIVKNGKDTYKA